MSLDFNSSKEFPNEKNIEMFKVQINSPKIRPQFLLNVFENTYPAF